MKTPRWTGIIVGILLVIFAGLSISSAIRESLTYDEIVHMQEGENALIRHTFLIDTYNPPLIRELATLPLVVGSGKLIHSLYPNIQVLPARLVVTTLGLVLCFGVFLVTKKYFGVGTALIALLLCIFEPNILAYSHYVTLDIGGTLFFFLTYMAFIRLLASPAKRNFIIFGISAGCMAAAKFTSLPFFAVSAVIASFFMFGKKTVSWFWSRRVLLCITICVALFTLWAAYFFKWDVVIVASAARGRLSERLTQKGNPALTFGIHVLKTQPIPLGNFVASLKNTAVDVARPKQVFYWGRFYDKAQWYFILVNALVKSSLPLILLFIMGIVVGVREKKLRRSVLLLGIPVVSVLVLSSFGLLPRAQARYLLPMYPFIIIIAASVLRCCKRPLAKLFLLILCVWHIIGILSFYPHFISYTNELIDRKTSYTKLIDSNIDWGQSLITFAEYVGRVKPSSIRFSYFGRDDGAAYGLPSKFAYGGYKEEDICAFHEITYPQNTGQSFTAISVSNWYYCGYYNDPRYSKNNLKTVVGDAILIY